MSDTITALDAPPVIDDALTAQVFSPENITQLLHLVLPHLEGGKRVLVYVLPASGRFAHMALEPWALDNLYGDAFDATVVVIRDHRQLPHSAGMRAVSEQVVSFVETDAELVIAIGHFDGAPYDAGPLRVQLQSAPLLLGDLWRHVRDGKPLRHLSLPPTLETRAAAFFSRIGMDPEAAFVTVHMREGGYLADHRYHSFRNITASNYEPAVRHLLDKGLWVFRLGDQTSSRLGVEHPRFIDLPFLDGYKDFMDVVLLAKARFALCCSSGPEGPARAFGTPMLLVNGILEQQSFLNPRDVILFKRYVDEADGERPIGYAELLERGVAGFSLAGEFAEAAVMPQENTPEEILGAVIEMEARLDGAFDADSRIDSRFRELCETHLVRRQGEERTAGGPAIFDGFGLALPWSTVCHTYCRDNPWFLGLQD